jgi:hypothetical protein
MSWLLWRQHRLHAASAALLLATLGILLAITGVVMANDYHSAVSACSRANATCDGLQLFRGDGAIIDTVNLTVAVPVLIGVFWGVTSVGREYDTGTNVLAWTQSVTRRQWLRGKVITLLASSLVAGALLSGMVTWWSGTLNSLDKDRFDPLKFDTQGLMPIAYIVFAAALGLFAGVLWRRVMPAIATTVAGYVAVRLPIEVYARPHFAAPVTTEGGTPNGAWHVSSDLRYHGRVVTGAVRVPDGCVGLKTRPGMDACMSRNGYSFTATYQPAGRYWTFQWIETGIFVGLAALLVAGAVVLVLRRDA